MDKKFSFYLQKNNKLFKSNILVVCYNADDEEKKKYGLTSNNILLFLRSPLFEHLDGKSVNYKSLIHDAFSKSETVIRIQSECLLGVYGDSHCDCEEQRLNVIGQLINYESSLLIYLPQEAQGWGLFYKLKELELQVSGRLPDGSYIGHKDRDSAQKVLLNTEDFEDKRNYQIVYDIFAYFGIEKNKFYMITDSERKIQQLENIGLDIKKCDTNFSNKITKDNVSEYLVKILNCTHEYSEDIIEKILKVISERENNERTLSAIISIADKIKNDPTYNLDEATKNKIMQTYNDIICGEEKKYILADKKNIKVQNNFSCKVDSTIFKSLNNIYGFNIFDRISLENMYYFNNKLTKESVKVKMSEILDSVNSKCKMFKGQKYAELTIVDENKQKIVQEEVTASKLGAFFENSNYDYVKRVEMITIISEDVLDGVNIYIKRLPKIDNRVMNIYGKKEDIKILLDKLIADNKNALLNLITDNELEAQNFSNYNLKFADIQSIIEEETSIYELTKGDSYNGV